MATLGGTRNDSGILGAWKIRDDGAVMRHWPLVQEIATSGSNSRKMSLAYDAEWESPEPRDAEGATPPGNSQAIGPLGRGRAGDDDSWGARGRRGDHAQPE